MKMKIKLIITAVAMALGINISYSLGNAKTDYASTSLNTPKVIDVRANDVSGSGFITEITVGLQSPQHGTITVLNHDSILYTPNAGYIGNDEFDYAITTPTCVTGWIDTAHVFVNIKNSSSSCQASFTYSVNCNVVSFVNNSGFATYSWLGLGYPNNTNNLVTYTFTANGIYAVCLQIKDSFGNPYTCDTACKEITINCIDSTQYNIPQSHVFTPNGDGKDDEIYIPCQTMEIFNRKGLLVRNINGSGVWDGKDNSGVLVPMGYYVARCKETKAKYGITVIR